MILAKFKYEDSNRINYIYIDHKNELVVFSIDNTGIKSVERYIIDDFIKMIHMSDSCSFVGKTESYDIYLDRKTNFKHYIKDGKEDFMMFFKNNGNNALLCEKENNNDTSNIDEKVSDEEKSLDDVLIDTMIDGFKSTKVKKFIALGLAFEISLYAFVGLFFGDFNIKDYVTHKYVYGEEYDIFAGKLNGEMLSVEEAIEFINNSSYLDSSDKKFLANYNLLRDVFPYYKGTAMQEDIKIKLYDISINYYNENDHVYEGTEVGYYSELKPSVINIFHQYEGDDIEWYDRCDRKAIMAHEFIHMLQGDIKYKYIEEASAELIAEEYFGTSFDTAYEEGVKSLKILTDIIGPEPILNMVFGSDDSDFKNILVNNLSYSDYNRLLKLFESRPEDVVEDETEIREILGTLYRNIYGQDIRSDQNILYDVMYSDYNLYDIGFNPGRVYFNKSDMSMENLFIDTYYLSMLFDDTPIMSVVEKKAIKKALTIDEYYKTSSSNGVSFSYECVPECKYVDGEIILYDGTQKSDTGYIYGNVVDKMSLSDAISRGYVVPYLKKYIDMDAELPDGFEYEYKNYPSVVETCDVYFSNIDNGIIENDFFIITVPSMKERFNVNTYEDSVQKVKTITQ